jgi:ribosomal protein S18 acetylase RimI-like enzyme
MLENYAKDIARAFHRPVHEFRTEARKQVKQLLKDGMATRGHHFLNIIEKKTGATIGHIWFSVNKRKGRAFLYDILVNGTYRGKGFGREAMQLLEGKLKDMGVSQLGLHVFAHNQVALNLYKSQGYYMASYNMQKEL